MHVIAETKAENIQIQCIIQCYVAIICIFDFINFMSFIIKFIKFKPIIKFKKFELHNYGVDYAHDQLNLVE